MPLSNLGRGDLSVAISALESDSYVGDRNYDKCLD